jgi:hypothetical protein
MALIASIVGAIAAVVVVSVARSIISRSRNRPSPVQARDVREADEEAEPETVIIE